VTQDLTKPDTVDAEVIDEAVGSSKVLEALTRAEVDVQIATAKRYPRVVSIAIKKATEMATFDRDTAASCRYSLKRTGEGGEKKTIEGPSTRLAEIVQSAWGNMRSAGRLISEEEKTVRVQGVAFDLESNSMVSVEVTRKIWSPRKGRFSPDMIATTINAAISIAVRNAVFKVVPRVYADRILEQCKQTVLGEAKTLEERRTALVESWEKKGVKQQELLEYLERTSVEDISLDDILHMSGVWTAIFKEATTTIDREFRAKDEAPTATADGATLEQALKGNVQAEDGGAASKKGKGKDLAAEAKGLFGGTK
jgi:hypothetical protein